MRCPLCENTKAQKFEPGFYHCPFCQGIFRDPKDYPSLEKEKARYEKHNNDVEDLGYQNFVSPITTYILKNFKPHDKGLDFGAGSHSVITQ